MSKGRISRRSFVGASLAVPAMAAMPLGLRGVAAQDEMIVTMVTDTAGLGDQNFNDSANAGGMEAAEEFGIEWRVIESVDAASYLPNITAGAEQGPLTVAVGYLLTQAVQDVASQYTDRHFTLIDSAVELDNVQSVLYKEQEAAFLVGVATGLTTKTNKVGLVGGERIPPVIRYEVGFQAGIQSVNSDAELVVSYVDSFNDPEAGKEFTLAQYSDGSDIVFPVAGLTGLGCYEAVKELGNEGEQWILGADVAQDHLAPGYELAVAYKGVAFGSYRAVKQEVEGNFEAGLNVLGLAEEGVAFLDPNGRVAPEVTEVVEEYKAAVIDGSIVPPATDEDMEAFEPTSL